MIQRRPNHRFEIAVLGLAVCLIGCAPSGVNIAHAEKAATVPAEETTTARAEKVGTAQAEKSPTSSETLVKARADESTESLAPAPPASLQEAIEVFDFRKFPRMEGEEVNDPSPTQLGYELRDASLEEAHTYNLNELTKAGWKIEKNEIDKAKSYGTLLGTKNGFMVNFFVTADPRSKKCQVFGHSYGNVDTRQLPRLGNARPVYNTFERTQYETNASLEDVAAFTRSELEKRGWREVRLYKGADPSRKPGKSDAIRCIQRGIGLDATIEVKEGKIDVVYHSRVLKIELPIMREATQSVELMESPVHLFYTANVNLDEAIAFHRKELPTLGWGMSKEPETTKDGTTRFAITSPDQKPFTLELLSIREGATSILITNLQRD